MFFGRFFRLLRSQRRWRPLCRHFYSHKLIALSFLPFHALTTFPEQIDQIKKINQFPTEQYAQEIQKLLGTFNGASSETISWTNSISKALKSIPVDESNKEIFLALCALATVAEFTLLMQCPFTEAEVRTLVNLATTDIIGKCNKLRVAMIRKNLPDIERLSDEITASAYAYFHIIFKKTEEISQAGLRAENIRTGALIFAVLLGGVATTGAMPIPKELLILGGVSAAGVATYQHLRIAQLHMQKEEWVKANSSIIILRDQGQRVFDVALDSVTLGDQMRQMGVQHEL